MFSKKCADKKNYLFCLNPESISALKWIDSLDLGGSQPLSLQTGMERELAACHLTIAV